MQIEENQVRDFMVKAGQDTPLKPVMPSPEVRMLRIKLIAEELMELATALNVSLVIDDCGEVKVLCEERVPGEGTSLIEAYDALEDIMVVTIGTGIAMGFNLQPGWDEVHRSNMSKFIDGHRREDGKWVKGPSYSPAQLAPIVEAQLNK